jgi:hypothetical protein
MPREPLRLMLWVPCGGAGTEQVMNNGEVAAQGAGADFANGEVVGKCRRPLWESIRSLLGVGDTASDLWWVAESRSAEVWPGSTGSCRFSVQCMARVVLKGLRRGFFLRRRGRARVVWHRQRRRRDGRIGRHQRTGAAAPCMPCPHHSPSAASSHSYSSFAIYPLLRRLGPGKLDLIQDARWRLPCPAPMR